MDQITFYGDTASGNCYKVRLLASLLDLQYHWQHIDILKGESKTPEFLAMNPTGAIPVMQLDNGYCLPESNAILFYLGQDSDYWPDDKETRALVLGWMFFEQYSHEPYVAVARFINKFLGLPEERKAEYESKQLGGHRALGTMNSQLETSGGFMCSEHPSIADIALFAYTHVADEGGFDLSSYPAIVSWIKRIQSLPGFKSMDDFKHIDSST